MPAKKIKIKTTKWNKPVGYMSPIDNHNCGRQQAYKMRKFYRI